MKNHEVENSPWQVPDECKELMDNDTMRFVYEEGEKWLKNLNSVSNKITERCYLIITMIASICPLVIGMLYKYDKYIFIAGSIYILAALIVVGWKLFLLIKPRIAHNIGDQPKDLININNLKSNNENSTALWIYEIERLQQKISYMQKNNSTRSRQYLWIIRTLFVLAGSFSLLLFIALATNEYFRYFFI